MKWRKIALIHLLMISIIVFSACSFGNQEGVDQRPEEASLKVMYYNDDSFQFDYGMLLSALFPHIEITVVGTNTIYQELVEGEEFDHWTALLNFIEKEKPDILMLEPEEFEKLANENMLFGLDTIVEQTNFDLQEYIPSLMEYLREAGNGQLYGLANSFTSRALYYNKDLFDQYQIPYPTDEMNWEELFQLAKRFPTDGEGDNKIYGLRITESRELFELASWIGFIEELTLVDPVAMQTNIGNDAWKHVFEQALDAIRHGSLYAIDGPAGGQSVVTERTDGGQDIIVIEIVDNVDPFIAGKVAMSLDYSSMVHRIKQAQQQFNNNEATIQNWDIVTIPVGKQSFGRNPHMMVRNIFAISADSSNKQAAWEVLSYMTGDNYARVRSKANFGGLSTRMAYLQDEEGHHYEAFYKLMPNHSFDLYGDDRKLPENFVRQFRTNAQKELARVLRHEDSLEKVLTELEQWANRELLSQ